MISIIFRTSTWEFGVFLRPHRLDAVDVAVREPTHVVGAVSRRRGSLSSIKDDPNEMNPRRWEALVERACGGHDDDMLHEMALAEQKGLAKPSPYRSKSPPKRRGLSYQ